MWNKVLLSKVLPHIFSHHVLYGSDVVSLMVE